MSLQLFKKCSALCAAFCFLALLVTGGCGHGAQYYIERGNELYAKGKYDDAVLTYKKAIQKDPNSGEAFYRLALADLKVKNGPEAYSALSRASMLLPNRDDINVQLGDLAFGGYVASPGKPRKLYDQVTQISHDLLKRTPKSFDGFRFAGDIALIDGRLPEAEQAFQQANAIRPMEPSAVGPWIDVLLKSNRLDEAEKLSRQLLEKHSDYEPAYVVLYRLYMASHRDGEAEQLLRARVQKHPSSKSAIVQLAAHYNRRHNSEAAKNTLQMLVNDPKDFPQAYADVGDFYVSFQAWDEALSWYQRGMTGKSAEKLFYERKSVVPLLAAKRNEEALGLLSEIVKQTPDDTEARKLLAEALLSTPPSHPDEAVSHLKQVLAKTPKDASATYTLGQAYLLKGDAEDARKQFIEAAKLQPNHIASRFALAELAKKDGNFREVLRYSDEIVSLDPKNAEAKLLRCVALTGTGNYEQARSELKQLLENYPDNRSVRRQLAILDGAQKNFAQARTTLERLHQEAPDDIETVQALLVVYRAEGHASEALQLLNIALNRAPDSDQLHFLLATTAAQAGKPDIAVQQYQWLVARHPKDFTASLNLVAAYEDQGKMKEALETLNKVRQMGPATRDLISRIAFLELIAGGENEAIADYRRVLKLQPDDANTMNNLAFLLADTGSDLDEALRLISDAQRRVPNNAGFSDTLGWIYTKKHMGAPAVRVFDTLVKQSPREALFHYHLGVALLENKDLARAKAEFATAASLQPSAEMKRHIAESLGEARVAGAL